MRHIAIYLIIISLLSPAWTHAQDSVLIAIQRMESPPYQWHDDQGKLIGVTPDLYRESFAELNYTVKFIEIDFFNPKEWKRVVSRLKTGEVDFAGPILHPTADLHDLAVSNAPFFTVAMGVYFLEGKEFPIPHFAALAEHKGTAVSAGIARNDEADKSTTPSLDLMFRPTMASAEALLRSGKVEYWFSPVYMANAYIYSRKLRGELVASPFQLDIPYYVMTIQDEAKQSLLLKFNEMMAEKHKSGKVQRLMDYHLKQYARYYSAHR